MEARDIMTREVIAVAPDMLVNEAADLLLRNRIHGAPVVAGRACLTPGVPSSPSHEIRIPARPLEARRTADRGVSD